MASGRTIGASYLTDKDHKILKLCEEIGNYAQSLIDNSEKRKTFFNNFCKMSFTRDSGCGRGAGKLQRDALCTRGITCKGPFSNRNFRWHPLIVSENDVPYAKTINNLEIEGSENAQTLVFYVDINGHEEAYRSDEIWKLPERFTAPSRFWLPYLDRFKLWNDTLWTQNSCAITAYEACNWEDAVEAYATLALAIVCDAPYNIPYNTAFKEIKHLIATQDIDASITLPSVKFPTAQDKKNVIACPLCLEPHSYNAASQAVRERPHRFNLELASNKRAEGDDNSLQIMHISPLVETEMRHNAQNVRFGHRWCNVAMTDHSIAETVDFMKFIVEAQQQ